MNPAPALVGRRAPGATAAGPIRDGAPAIEVVNLTKSYGDVAAVAGVDLEIQAGEIFALLGPNGAGKTTTVEILEGYRHRDGGQVSVLGLDPEHDRQQLKPRIGIVLQSTGVDRYLTVAETIQMYASYYPHPRPVAEIVELVGLVAKRDTRVIKLSGGQQRRLDVAIGLAGDPDLLFLDEPTTGFDPSARREAWEVVKNLAVLGKTVLLTTHYMDEAQYLADRVAVMAAGRIVATGTPEQLGGRQSKDVRIRFRVPDGTLLPVDLRGETLADGCVELVPDDVSRVLYRLTGWSIESGIELEQLEIIRKSLEDVYLELVGDPMASETAGTNPPAVVPRP
ncbi:MAG TPA: ABC transporter ATP-binding protein [Acidimicrobiales bacterium]|nr:ABC transporter ATP-binding protein [Acidimicrobiales bacterium]